MHRLTQATLAVMLVGMALVGPASAAPADAVVGDGTPGSCTEAAFSAAIAHSGLVTFNCGGPATIVLTVPRVTNVPLTIDGGGVITLTGNLGTRFLTLGPSAVLTLDNIVLTRFNGGATSGGAINNQGGTLVLNYASILQSQTDPGELGGAIASTGPVMLNHSKLKGNRSGSGGAIFLQSPAQLTIVEGHMDHNSAAGNGGALYLTPGTSADIEPGPFFPANFIGNSAKSGGAIFNQGGVINLLGGDFDDNHALTVTSIISGYGGAIDDQGLLSVSASLFQYNEARNGGAVYVGGAGPTATAAISDTDFLGNDAVNFGGALYTDVATATVSLEAVGFDGNQAFLGGGVARTNAQLSVSRASFTGNQAQFGGGLFAQGQPDPSSAGYVEVHDSTFAANMAGDKLSGALDNSALLDLRNVTVKDNQGGLYDENGAVGRLQSTVLDNGDFHNCSGDGTLPASGGHNLATDLTCNLSAGAGDQAGVAAGLGPLTTLFPLVITDFYMPLAGSPLIHNGGPGCSPTDQRYAKRVGACDIGAVEFGGLIPQLYVPMIQR